MIANRVSRLMGDRREGIRALARATGIGYSTAYRLYHGTVERIDFATLAKLCEHFGVTPERILEYVPEGGATP